MNETSEWTMSDKPKKSVGQTLKDIEIEDGKKEVRLDKLERWKDGWTNESGEKVDGVDDHIKRQYLYWKILWTVGSVLGAISMALFSWLLSKI